MLRECTMDTGGWDECVSESKVLADWDGQWSKPSHPSTCLHKFSATPGFCLGKDLITPSQEISGVLKHGLSKKQGLRVQVSDQTNGAGTPSGFFCSFL